MVSRVTSRRPEYRITTSCRPVRRPIGGRNNDIRLSLYKGCVKMKEFAIMQSFAVLG
jgi:hypothetical protein